MNFVGLELFSCHGVKRGADVEVLPHRVCFCNANDICSKGRDTREIVSVVLASFCRRQSFDILEKDADGRIPSDHEWSRRTMSGDQLSMG